mmetsp:Transcript_52639/g.105659  ORF Transcript_52639/g.105659 Transcript_52639/m.105659 type:complete len:214 (+) Transcript_52639:52-693(+)
MRPSLTVAGGRLITPPLASADSWPDARTSPEIQQKEACQRGASAKLCDRGFALQSAATTTGLSEPVHGTISKLITLEAKWSEGDGARSRLRVWTEGRRWSEAVLESPLALPHEVSHCRGPSGSADVLRRELLYEQLPVPHVLHAEERVVALVVHHALSRHRLHPPALASLVVDNVDLYARVEVGQAPAGPLPGPVPPLRRPEVLAPVPRCLRT